MSYTKNVAVIKGVKDGFSADGGALSGIIKAERYAGNLMVEVSLINFAPVTEGRYVCALSDGPHTEIVENCLFSGASEVDTSQGFGAAVFYVNGSAQVIATAVCGNFQTALFGLKGEIERAERFKPTSTVAAAGKYEDEAIAEENYYEYDEHERGQTDAGGEPVCAGAEKEEDGFELRADEAGVGDGGQNAPFYKKMRAEIDGILSAYPREEGLCSAVENSEWVRISYGDGAYYVFGLIRENGAPRYICYGIPARDPSSPPAGMRGLASFLDIAADSGHCGYWVMYQDAFSGNSLEASTDFKLI